MRAVVQRVLSAGVSMEGRQVASIGPGLVVLLGVERGDGEDDLAYMTGKLPRLRIFEDAAGRSNLDVLETGGSILLVSQFTLCGDARHGRRPGYTDAAPPELARALYEACAARLGALLPVQTGVFRADMQVSLVNDGPFTILLDSRRRF